MPNTNIHTHPLTHTHTHAHTHVRTHHLFGLHSSQLVGGIFTQVIRWNRLFLLAVGEWVRVCVKWVGWSPVSSYISSSGSGDLCKHLRLLKLIHHSSAHHSPDSPHTHRPIHTHIHTHTLPQTHTETHTDRPGSKEVNVLVVVLCSMDQLI